MANIRMTDKQTVTPTGSDFMLINQAGSGKNTTLSRLKTYMNGSTALETEAQDTNSAINEVNTKATNASTGLNGIKNTIGNGTLETTSQNLIGATNEINTKVGSEKLETSAENCTGAINELKEGVDNNTQSLVEVNASLKENTQSIANNLKSIENIKAGLSVKTATATPQNGATINVNIVKKCGKYVEIDIGITGITTVGNTIVANIPEGYRPPKYRRVPGVATGSNVCRFEIFTNGDIKISTTTLSNINTGDWFEFSLSYLIE